MINFLLILSILFNFVAFISIYLLFLRQNRLIHKEEKQQKALNEIEETFSNYLLELKEDNAIFLKQFKQLNKDPQQRPKNPDTSVKKFVTTNEIPSSILKATKNLAANRYRTTLGLEKSVEEEFVPAISEEKLEEKVVRLHQEGIPIADIAKSLQKGQTEIELMLKFHSKTK